ncbi:MAG: PAS domain-containing protein [Gemmatimonadales bacterium]
MLSSSTPLRYALSLAALAAAASLVQLLRTLGLGEAPAVLLLAVAGAGLLGGIGPGAMVAVLAAAFTRDPVVLGAGAVLAGLCGAYHRGRARTESELRGLRERGELDTVPAAPAPEPPPPASPPSFFARHTTEATWRFHHEQPLDITLPEAEQVEHFYLYSYLAECNDAFARMYGFRSAAEVVGTRLVVFLPPSDQDNIAYLRSFIRSGYRLEDAESHEIDRYGNTKCFVNNLVGILRDGQLVGAWGTQRDVTHDRQIHAAPDRG